MHRVRLAVQENRLTSSVVTEDDYLPAIETTGRGWVIEAQGLVVSFAIGTSTNGNIWALFVDPGHERQGYGRRLHDTMVEWLWSQGHETLWLTTAPGTRAQGFYQTAGWQCIGSTRSGELKFELSRLNPAFKPTASSSDAAAP